MPTFLGKLSCRQQFWIAGFLLNSRQYHVYDHREIMYVINDLEVFQSLIKIVFVGRIRR